MHKLFVAVLAAGLLSVSASAQIPNLQPRIASPAVGPNAAALQRLRNALAATPASRPARRQFLNLLVEANGDAAAFRRGLLAANIQLKVQRICDVSGGYPSAAICARTSDVIKDLQRSPADVALFNLAMNDLWETLGGAPAGGDLNTCGGRAALSVTNLTTGPSSGGSAAALTGFATGASTKGGASAQAVSGSAAAAKTNDCRNAQKAGLAGGFGSRNVPGSPGYRQAVANTQSFLANAGAMCRDGSSSNLVAAPAGAGGGGMTASDAAVWLAGATADLAGAMDAAGEVMEGCGKGKASCVVGVVGAALSAVGDANDLVGNDGAVANAVDKAGTAADVVGVAVSVYVEATAATATVAVADMVLPAIAVLTVSYTLTDATGAGGAVANVADPAYVALGDFFWELQNGDPTKPAQGTPKTPPSTNPPATDPPATTPPAAAGKPGVSRPAEEGRSCDDIAARAARFNAYCSQPGNDWQTYDCMSFVAQLNGCADPALVNPAPGEDFQCSSPQSDRAKTQAACEQHATLRGLLERRTPDGSTSSRCAALGSNLSSFKQRQRQQLCQRVNVDDPNGFCAGARAQGAPNRFNTRP
jgi:hypothetical protein